MDNKTMLEDELNEYLRLENEKKSLEDSLRGLSGKNDEESLRRINEIGKRLGEINNILSLYNKETLENMKRYMELRDKFNKISEDIKKIEELSKEGKRPNSNAEFIKLSSPEGRDKDIDKRLASDYIKLVEDKKKIKTELDKAYNLVKGKISMKNDIALPEEKKKEEKDILYDHPKLATYDDLSVDDKIKETTDRLDRIFASSKLPNMGKKVFITHNGIKYEIPEKYKGLLKATQLELAKLEKQKEGKLEKPVKEEKPKVEEAIVEEVKEAVMVDTKEMPRAEKLHKKLGVPYNPEKQKRMEELVEELFSKEYQPEKVSFKEGIKQKVSIAKSYVATTSKKVINTLEEKYQIKEKYEKAKEVVSEKKDEALYQISNRSANFKKNVCLKVNEKKSKIAEVNKSFLDRIRKPFDRLRESAPKYVSKKELLKQIEELRSEVNALKDEKTKVKTRTLTNPNLSKVGGFVSTAAFVFTVSLLITVIIFVVVGYIVFK